MFAVVNTISAFAKLCQPPSEVKGLIQKYIRQCLIKQFIVKDPLRPTWLKAFWLNLASTGEDTGNDDYGYRVFNPQTRIAPASNAGERCHMVYCGKYYGMISH